MNSSFVKKCIILIILFSSSFLAFFVSTLWAGNQELVEEKVKELDRINKEMLQQLPDIPRDGSVDVKANISIKKGEKKFDILYKEIHEPTNIREDTINFNGTK